MPHSGIGSSRHSLHQIGLLDKSDHILSLSIREGNGIPHWFDCSLRHWHSRTFGHNAGQTDQKDMLKNIESKNQVKHSRNSQLLPVQPGVHWQLPFTGSHLPPFTQRQWERQFGPYKPGGHAAIVERGMALCALDLQTMVTTAAHPSRGTITEAGGWVAVCAICATATLLTIRSPTARWALLRTVRPCPAWTALASARHWMASKSRGKSSEIFQGTHRGSAGVSSSGSSPPVPSPPHLQRCRQPWP